MNLGIGYWYAVTVDPSDYTVYVDDVETTLTTELRGSTLIFLTPVAAADGSILTIVTDTTYTFTLSSAVSDGRILIVSKVCDAASSASLTIINSGTDYSETVTPTYDTDRYYYLVDIDTVGSGPIYVVWNLFRYGEADVSYQTYPAMSFGGGLLHGALIKWSPSEYNRSIIGYEITRNDVVIGVVSAHEFLDTSVTSLYQLSDYEYSVTECVLDQSDAQKTYSLSSPARDISVIPVRTPLCALHVDIVDMSGGDSQAFNMRVSPDAGQFLGNMLLVGSDEIHTLNGSAVLHLPQGSVVTLRIDDMGIRQKVLIPAVSDIMLSELLG